MNPNSKSPDRNRPGAGIASDPVAKWSPLVYDRMRELAGRLMRGERAQHTFQPTDLVHETFLRMVELDRIDWQDRQHYLAVAATQMRRILIEQARRRNAEKRGGGWTRITLDDDITPTRSPTVDPLELDQALSRLAELSRRQERLVEMRMFAGMTLDEVANALDISERTARREWRAARAWLSRELARS